MRESVRKFAEQTIKPRVMEMDRTMQMDKAVIRGMFDNGLMALDAPAEYGGTGASFMATVLCIEELARVDAAVSASCDVHNTVVVGTVVKYANEAQKREWLPRLATDTFGSFCLSEVGSGSDAFAMRTSAKDAGDHWLLNGSKMWITNAAEAGLFLVFANTDFSKGYKGITCFIVPRSTPGLVVGKKEDKLGIRASSTCPDAPHRRQSCPSRQRARPASASATRYAIEMLNEGRIGIGAQMVGVAQRRVRPHRAVPARAQAVWPADL
jgi:short/branched chain acyl-CoA dehydrogenase